MKTSHLLHRTVVLVAALQAWRARSRGDGRAYAAAVNRAVARLLSAGPLPGWQEAGGLAAPLRAVDPVGHTRGGFFAAMATTANGDRVFVKCVRATSREARFWTLWRQGLIRTGGAHYRIETPLLALAGPDLCLLAFPALQGIPARRSERGRAFRAGLDAAVRAIAEFNADHMGPAAAATEAARACGPLPVPRRSEIARALEVDAAEAAAIRDALASVERGWDRVRDEVEDWATRCLSHLDFGPGNVVLGDGRATIQDFGLAGVAPAGTDLHTIYRYATPLAGGWIDPDLLVGPYVETFLGKGVLLDPAAVRRALEAHFAVRYRNLRLPSAQKRPAFDAALARSRALAAGRRPQAEAAAPREKPFGRTAPGE